MKISTEDAQRIRYILEIVLQYINEVGPRDLRDHSDEIAEFIKKLPTGSDDDESF